MVKIYHRPDPPPPDVDSNRAVRKTDTFLNREASAGLFQRALVKAQGHDQAVERAKLAGSGQQQQIESDAHSVLGTKAKENVLASRSESNVSKQNAELSAAELNVGVPDDEAGKLAAELAELEVPDDSTDADSADQATQDSDFASSSTELDSSAAYQMFENIQQHNYSAEAELHADSTAISDNGNNGPDTTQTSQTAVAHSASSTVATTESRIDTISGMSDLIEMLETSSQLPAGNEWTLILDNDGPVSELTLSSGSDGRWNIDLLTSFENDFVDENLIGDLRSQLDTAGIAVANIAFVDRAQSGPTSTDNIV